MFACSGILYNHESERRPEHFVSRKITRAAAAIKLGLADHVVLGDLSAVRDWSFAGDVMRGAWLMLQQEEPDDYVLASGVGHTVGELAEIAFERVGLVAGGPHPGRSRARPRARDDPPGRRPQPSPRAARLAARRCRFEQLIHRMVDADLQALQADLD